MGRGRQKAKATKQARDMKYFSPETDYAALERELTKGSHNAQGSYAQYIDEYDDEADRRTG